MVFRLFSKNRPQTGLRKPFEAIFDLLPPGRAFFRLTDTAALLYLKKE